MKRHEDVLAARSALFDLSLGHEPSHPVAHGQPCAVHAKLSSTSAIPFGVHSGRIPKRGLQHCMRSHEWRDHTSAFDVVAPDAYFYAPSLESLVAEKEYAPHRPHAIQMICLQIQDTDK